MRLVPVAIPVTIPVEDPTVATPGVLLVHVPPGVACDSVVVEPTQVVSEPVIGPGVVTTFTVVIVAHPPTLYEISAVPAETPVTIPVVTPTVATPGALVNQNPPDGELLNAVVDPTHTPRDPVIVDGYGFTVTVIVEKQVAIP